MNTVDEFRLNEYPGSVVMKKNRSIKNMCSHCL